MWADRNGNFIRQKFYPNKYSGTDHPRILISTRDQNYMILGTAYGSMPPFGHYGAEPRFLKITPDGTILLDTYHSLNSGGVSPWYDYFTPISEDFNLILTHDDRGIAISTINDMNEIERHVKLYGYPRSILLRKSNDGDYHCISQEGIILVFAIDGYFDNKN